MKKKSILIPDGESPFAYHVVSCLSVNNDIELHILSKSPRVVSRYSRKVKSFRAFNESQSLLDNVKAVCANTHIDMCMPVDMEGTCYFSAHRDDICDITILALMDSPEKLMLAGDKGLLANYLQTHNLPHPYSITNHKQFEKEKFNLSFPVLIKPRISGNGDGIFKQTSLDSLIAQINTNSSFFDEYLIQEYIDGEDIDCSVLCKNGVILAYTIQKTLVVNTEDFKPAVALEFTHHAGVFETAQKLLSTLNWNGVAHIDMRIKKSDLSAQIIEINPRFWGSVEGSLHVGVNFPYLLYLTTMEQSFSLPSYRDSKYMNAFSALRRQLENRPLVNLYRETNMKSYIKDPLPIIMRVLNYKK